MLRKLLCLPVFVIVLTLIVAPARAQSQPQPQLPTFYKNVDRLIWVTHDATALVKAWQPLGLTVQLDLVTSHTHDRTAPNARIISAHLDNLALDIIQPVGNNPSIYSSFLARHGDGIFAVLFYVTPDQLQQETQRLQALGASTIKDRNPGYTLFDTEPQGKYVIGLINHPGPPATQPPTTHPITVTHIGILVRDPRAVAAYWHSLGFPSFSVGSEPQRNDFTYRGQPLHLAFGTAVQPFAQLTFEWIRAAATPDNLYNDFYKTHHNQEGIQHLGFGVRNLAQAVALFQRAGFTPTQSGHWNGPNNQIIPYTGMEGTPNTGGIQAELVQTN